ncbi:hypothetical protein K443DRAFT_684091 [Laccaria amethystina LaAM-08-1]|uniref:Uncharacterized protein n=1 Tax=Laccaria amethystina LaAM-08-1 TaxID=1095629 RepID=A0A0C9WYL6_9AGAR|nr:hypothetical protein K443DRAFT_684091 [Laccaria amethystina LaAM-08-1]
MPKFAGPAIVCFMLRLKPDVQTHSESEAEDPRNDRIDEQRTGFALGCSKLDFIHLHPTRRTTERVLCAPSGRYRGGGWRVIDISGQDHDHWVLITHDVPDSSPSSSVFRT